MLSSRRGRIMGGVLAGLVLAAGCWLCWLCASAGQPAYAAVVAISFCVMSVCIMFLVVKSILDAEQAAYRDRGFERARFQCGCEYRDFFGNSGELVFYEKGLAYEESGKEPLGLFPYGKFSHAAQDGGDVMVFVAHSLKARVMTVSTKGPLKARAVMNVLAANGIPEK